VYITCRVVSSSSWRRDVTQPASQPASRGVEVGRDGSGLRWCVLSTCCRYRCHVDKVGPTQIRSDQLIPCDAMRCDAMRGWGRDQPDVRVRVRQCSGLANFNFRFQVRGDGWLGGWLGAGLAVVWCSMVSYACIHVFACAFKRRVYGSRFTVYYTAIVPELAA
jgi:hypothetical protein